MSWKDEFLPSTNFSGDVRKNFRLAKKADIPALRWLRETELPDSNLAADVVEMWLLLDRIPTGSRLWDHIRTAVGDPEEARMASAQSYLKNRAREEGKGSPEEAAVAYLKLRLSVE